MSGDTQTNGSVIRAVRVSKWYGPVTALEQVSLDLGPGIWGLLGPNGSGKTTFMNLVAGQFRPSLGELRVLGDAPFDAPRVLARVGYCPEADAMYDELTGHAFVTSLARLGGFSASDAAARAEAILTRLDLKGAMHRPIGGYSRGMRQRAKLAQALVHDPEVLLLDEPLTGTDPISRQTILQEVRERAQAGTTVLFSTHVLHEVESLTDQVLLIVRGQVVAQGRTADIRAMMAHRPHHVRVDVSEPRALARALAEDPSVVALFLAGEGAVTVATKDPDSTYTAIARAIVDGNHELRALTSPDATLEALFHDLVERASRGAGTGSDAAVGSRHPGGTP